MEHWARKYIGLKYQKDGMGPKTFNCWTLVAHIEAVEFGRVLPFFSTINGDDWMSAAQMMRDMEPEMLGWKLGGQREEGDIFLAGHGRYATHAGVFAANGVVHALEKSGVIFSIVNPVFCMQWPKFDVYTYIGN